MKKTLTTLFIYLLVGGCVFSQNVQEYSFTLNEFNSDFVGSWKFVKRLDQYGNKIDTIWYGKGYEIAAGPLTILREGRKVLLCSLFSLCSFVLTSCALWLKAKSTLI